MAKYRKKPVVIEARKYNGDKTNAGRICRWINDGIPTDEDPIASFITKGQSDKAHDFQIWTKEGIMEATPGDYIIKGVEGEYYPCKPDIFNKTYDKV